MSLSRSRVPPIDPLTLTSLRGWYKSDTGITIVTGVSQWNRRYLAAKRDWGHALSDLDVLAPDLKP
jgi:hypothetical protein